MEVKLNRRFAEFVREQVEAGLYDSAEEMVRDALRLLERAHQARLAKLEALRREVDVGLAELDAGQGEPWDPEAIKQDGRRRRSARDGAR
jgi:antitoxin ParD1/3/4